METGCWASILPAATVLARWSANAAGRLGHGLGTRPTSRSGQLWPWHAASPQSAVTVAVARTATRVVAARWWRTCDEMHT
jgi:hypothetical protein